ncbi:MAG: hypothetical protein GX442_19450 [Candidatus Riflebacteria bacterium]|nr:hypothetical protein [Candidatus Riflebacteria bacterium]
MKLPLVLFLACGLLVTIAGCGGGGDGDGGGSPVTAGGGSTATLPEAPAVDTTRQAAGLGQSGGAVGLVVALPSLAEEQPVVKAKVEALQAALTAKNAEQAAGLFDESVRASYQTLFAAQADKLPELASALGNATLTTLSDEYGGITSRPRRAELTITYQGNTFHVGMVKVDDAWQFLGM